MITSTLLFLIIVVCTTNSSAYNETKICNIMADFKRKDMETQFKDTIAIYGSRIVYKLLNPTDIFRKCCDNRWLDFCFDQASEYLDKFLSVFLPDTTQRYFHDLLNVTCRCAYPTKFSHDIEAIVTSYGTHFSPGFTTAKNCGNGTPGNLTCIDVLRLMNETKYCEETEISKEEKTKKIMFLLRYNVHKKYCYKAFNEEFERLGLIEDIFHSKEEYNLERRLCENGCYDDIDIEEDPRCKNETETVIKVRTKRIERLVDATCENTLNDCLFNSPLPMIVKHDNYRKKAEAERCCQKTGAERYDCFKENGTSDEFSHFSTIMRAYVTMLTGVNYNCNISNDNIPQNDIDLSIYEEHRSSNNLSLNLWFLHYFKMDHETRNRAVMIGCKRMFSVGEQFGAPLNEMCTGEAFPTPEELNLEKFPTVIQMFFIRKTCCALGMYYQHIYRASNPCKNELFTQYSWTNERYHRLKHA